jgi:hypothetical protein
VCLVAWSTCFFAGYGRWLLQVQADPQQNYQIENPKACTNPDPPSSAPAGRGGKSAAFKKKGRCAGLVRKHGAPVSRDLQEVSFRVFTLRGHSLQSSPLIALHVQIKLQEQVQRLNVGSIPRSIRVVLTDDLVDSCHVNSCLCLLCRIALSKQAATECSRNRRVMIFACWPS